MKKEIKIYFLKTIVIFVLFFSASCVPTKKLVFFNDINELEEPVVNPRTQKLIMPFDNLYIRVISIDEKTNQIFNSSDQVRFNTTSNMISYTVDESGDITFPFVGKIKVGSLTTSEASVKIQNALNDYVSNTSIIVKYVDNQVTIMGEVVQQGVFPFTQDKLNIYEALALGRGLTRYGNRKNIILIRQEGDKIMHYRLNLSDSKIASKDYYYILPNDVLVVEPMKPISNSYQNMTYSSILTSITTLIAVLFFAGVNP